MERTRYKPPRYRTFFYAIFLIVLLSLIAYPVVFVTATRAATTYAINGRGFGHGIGMSQWGAAGYAQQGLSYQEILTHYFTDTQVVPAADSSPNVRILLKTRSMLTVSGVNSTNGGSLDASKRYRIKRSGSQIVLRAVGSRSKQTLVAPLVLNGPQQQFVLRGRAVNGITSATYEGSLQITLGSANQLEAVDVLGMDDYLKGVVPMEVPASWPQQALLAQAVAARSYALATKKSSGNFDEYADTRSQMYGGLTVEKPTTSEAVDATSGQIVSYQGKVATAYFFSSSGGKTENIEYAWPGSKPVPYLVGVDDPYDGGSPYHQWGPVTLTDAQLAHKLGGRVKGELKDLQVAQTGPSGRVVEAKVVGSQGESTVSGPKLRQLLGLRSTWFTISRKDG